MKKHKYDKLQEFSEGLALVCRDGLWGYIDKNGNEIIPCQFEKCTSFCNGMAQVAVNVGLWDNEGVQRTKGSWGLIDKHGDYIIPPEHNWISYCSEDCVVCQDQNGDWFYLGLDGEMLFRQTFEGARPFDTGVAIVCRSGKYGAIDRKGNTAIPFEFDWINEIGRWNSNKMVGVKKSGKFGVIDRVGNMIIDFRYDEVSCFRTGLIEVGFKGRGRYSYKYGVIDAAGETILPCIYDEITCMESVIGINIGKRIGTKCFHPGKWGWTDLEGNIIVEPQYANVTGVFFSDGLAAVEKRNKTGFADEIGNIVIPFQYEYSCGFEYGMALVRHKNRYGFIDKQGAWIIPAIYDSLEIFQDDYAVAELDGESFYIDRTGKRVLF